MDKNGYIRQLKQLIKKYHPDLCSNSYLESMYNEITKILINKLNDIKSNHEYKTSKGNEPPPGSQDIASTKRGSTHDYMYYNLGIKYYKNIHPNKFYKRNPDSTFETKTYNELVSILNKIYLSFNMAEYYFKKVIEDYSQSPYYDDSKTKIKLLKKLYKSYENIVLEENKIINNDKYINEMGLKIL